MAAIACVASSTACTTGATEVLVFVDTDIDRGRTLSLVVNASEPNATDVGTTRSFDGTTLDAGLTFPLSFAVVPPSGGPADDTISLTLALHASAAGPRTPAIDIRRVVVFQLTPHTTNTLRVFLPAACGDIVTGCTHTPAAQCTRSQFCGELNATCGDNGSCVSQRVTPASDAGDASNDLVRFEAGDIVSPVDGGDATGSDGADVPSVTCVVGGACDTGMPGVCAAGTVRCFGASPQCAANAAPSAESCNGLDDNCDGVVDEGNPGGGAACGTGRPGICAAGTTHCQNASLQCVSTASPSPEACNGIDDDCDGVIDNGFRAIGLTVTYSALTAVVPSCNGSNLLAQPCYSAFSRYCAMRGCTTSGFGPEEIGSSDTAIGCVMADANMSTTYTTLHGIQALCDGSSTRIGVGCNAAIHRWCINRGYVSGFGPVEASGDNVTVTCVRGPSAQVFNPSWGELAAFAARCNGTTSNWGTDCNAAVHRYCTNTQHLAAGWGPVEVDANRALVVCFQP